MRPRLAHLPALLVAAFASLALTAPPAWAGTYVSLGDSYSSGVGAGSYDIRSLSCHRSKHAWPRLLGVRKEHHLACSGAKIEHMVSKGQKRVGLNRRKQLHRLNKISETSEVDTVFLTIGGNNLDFAGKIASCRVARRNCLTDRAKIDRELAAVVPKLANTYKRVYASAQPRRLAVVGYPDIIPNEGEQTVRCTWLKAAKRKSIEYLQEKLDATLKSATDAAGAIYIPVRDALRSDDNKTGHELCTKDSWMYPITSLRSARPTLGTLWSAWQQQAHPTKAGQRALAAEVRAGLDAWDTATGEFCWSEGPHPATGITTVYAHLVSCDVATRVRVEFYEGEYGDRLRGNWHCRIIGGTPNTDDVPEVRCENNGRFVRWTHT